MGPLISGKSRLVKYYNLARYMVCWVVATQSFFFSSIFGEMIQFDEHIFQMGWFNHQLVWKPLWGSTMIYCGSWDVSTMKRSGLDS